LLKAGVRVCENEKVTPDRHITIKNPDFLMDEKCALYLKPEVDFSPDPACGTINLND